MIFVSTEKSKQLQVTAFFASLYDATPKEYPNGIMLLFIPIREGITYDNEYRHKIIFKNEQYLGNEAAISIMGLKDLNTVVKLKNDIAVSIHTLIKSLPASHGMSLPQLFHHVEQNTSGGLTMATFQECDRKYIQDHKLTLESEIRSLLAPQEDEKNFQSSADGLWFDNVHKNKNGHIMNTTPASKVDLEHMQHTRSILSSPPKKRLNSTIITNPTQTINVQTRPSQPALQPQHQHTQVMTDTKMQLIHVRFVTVENELKIQNERDETFNQRICSLEMTTQQSDVKLDLILGKLEQWDDSAPVSSIKLTMVTQIM